MQCPCHEASMWASGVICSCRLELELLCCCVQDLAKDRAPHYKRARRFFDGVAAQLVQQQQSLDVFACALDQARLPDPDMPYSLQTSLPLHRQAA